MVVVGDYEVRVPVNCALEKTIIRGIGSYYIQFGMRRGNFCDLGNQPNCPLDILFLPSKTRA